MTYTDEHAAERLAYWKDRLSGTSICDYAPGELDDQDIREIADLIADLIVDQERELDERRHQAQVLIVAEGLLEAAGLRPDVGAAVDYAIARMHKDAAWKRYLAAEDATSLRDAREATERAEEDLAVAEADLLPAPAEPRTCQSCGVVVTEDSDACRACEEAR